MRAERGPGIELLGYLSPTDGRDIPADLHANDIAHWEPSLAFDQNSLAEARNTARAANIRLYTRKSFAAAGESGAELLAQDPHGHVIVFHSAPPNSVSRITSAVEF